MVVNYCSNPALNALFGYYHEMAVSNGILVNWNIGLPNPLTVSELDMANLFVHLQNWKPVPNHDIFLQQP